MPRIHLLHWPDDLSPAERTAYGRVWKQECRADLWANDYSRAHAIATVKRLEGCMTIAEIAAEMGVGEDKAREHVNALIRSQWAERVQGKMVNASGAIINTTYYRLLRAE